MRSEKLEVRSQRSQVSRVKRVFHLSPFTFHLRDERGTALVITMFALVLLSIMGVFSLSTTSTDLNITANVRNADEALYAAEKGVEFAAVTASGTAVQNFTVDSDTSGIITYIITGDPPVGVTCDPETCQAMYYVVETTGTGPNNSEANVEAQVAVLIANPES